MSMQAPWRPDDPVRPHRPVPPVTPPFVFGLFIMLAGIILMLDQLNLVDAAQTVRFWPLAVILFGATIWARRTDANSRFFGLIWIVIGTWMLLNTLNLVDVGFWQVLWPALLIAFGARIVMKTLRGEGPPRPSPGEGRHLYAMFTETKRRVDTVFKGADMTAFMGGCVLDLRQATMEPGEEKAIDVFGVFAEHKILVPAGWTVVLDVMPVFADAEDKRVPPVVQPPPVPGIEAPRLVVRGVVVFANVKIDD